METLTNLMIISMCINVGMYTVLSNFPVFQASELVGFRNTINKTVITGDEQRTAAEVPGTIDPNFYAGTFTAAITIFFSFLTGTHFIDVISAIGVGISPELVWGIAGIHVVYLVATFVTLLGGRIFKGSP